MKRRSFIASLTIPPLSTLLTAAENSTLNKEFLVGAASKQIEVQKNSLFGVWRRHLLEIRPDDHIMASALVLDDGTSLIAIVSIDVTNIYGGGVDSQPNWVEAIRDELESKGLKFDSMLVCATHNHAGPPDEAKGNSVSNIISAAVDAVFEAWKTREAAEVALGSEQAPASSYNRIPRIVEAGQVVGANPRHLRPGGELSTAQVEALNKYLNEHSHDIVDHNVRVAHFRNILGKSIATIVNYASHPVTHGPENSALSADYPGIVRRSLKEVVGGEVLFLQGAAGDIQPWCGIESHQKAIDAARGIAGIISDQSINIIRKFSSSSYVKSTSIKSKRIFVYPKYSEYEKRKLKNWIINKIEINIIQLCEGIFLSTVPGEFFSSYAAKVRQNLNVNVKELLFVGYTHDAIGYIPDSNLYELYNKPNVKRPKIDNVTLEQGVMFAPSRIGDDVCEIIVEAINSI